LAKLLWRRNDLFRSNLGQWPGSISGIRPAAENDKDGDEEQKKYYENS
jgi:hypothetical protein